MSASIYGMRYVYEDGVNNLTDEIHIIGSGFGSTTGRVFLLPIKDYNEAPIISWTDNKIVVSYTEEKSPTALFNMVRVVLSDGTEADDYSRPLDFGVPSQSQAWTVSSTEQVADGSICVLGTNLLSVVDAFLVEDGTDEEYHGTITTKTYGKLLITFPPAADGPLTKLLLVGKNQSGNKLASEQLEASAIDVNKDAPGFVGWVKPLVGDRAFGRGIRIPGVPSNIAQVKMLDSNGNTLFRGVANSGPGVWDPSHNRSHFVQAHYTSASLNELVVRWPETVAPKVYPANYLEPIVQLELVDFQTAPIIVTPNIDEDWQFSPAVTGLTFDSQTRKITVEGNHLLGAYVFICEVERVSDNAPTNKIIGFLSSDPYTSVTSLTDTQLVTLSVDDPNFLGPVLSFGGDHRVVGFDMRIVAGANYPSTTSAARLDLSGSPVLIPAS